MSYELTSLVSAIQRWREKGVEDYWVQVDYIGSSLNRMGNHVLTVKNGKVWHQWHEAWREIEVGSDYWLFTVPGSFAWAREMINSIGNSAAAETPPVVLQLNPDYGYVELLRVKMPERDAANFTFETKSFGVGTHPDFRQI